MSGKIPPRLNLPPELGAAGMSGQGPIGGGAAAIAVRGEKARDFKGAVKKLIGYIGKHKTAVMLVFWLAAASTVFMIAGPRILAGVVDELLYGFMGQVAGAGGIDFAQIAGALLFLAALYLAGALLSLLQGVIMSGITVKITHKLRTDISSKIHRLPLRFFDSTTHGEVLSRIASDVDTVNEALSQNLTRIITSVTSVTGACVMMFTISCPLALAALCILPLSAAFIAYAANMSQKYFYNQQRFLGKLNGYVEEMFGSHIVVKAFGCEEDALEDFDKYNNILYGCAWKASFLSGLIMPVTFFLGNIGYIVISVLGGVFAANGHMTVGGILALILYVRNFNHPLSNIAGISNVIQQTAAAAERVFEFLDAAEETPEIANALSVRRADIRTAGARQGIERNIIFDHAVFGYHPGKTVIRGFSADIRTGQKIAIVGPTGAGKTTLVKLLMRFYDLSGGAILLGGHDIRMFRRGELRSLFGVVLQDAWLFSGTIADNIRYGRPAASDEDVIAAAKAAQVDNFVRALPDGYNMIINEESDNISQGQKQLITIARAFLADPEILILDEATSSVDTRTEALIQKAMDGLMKGRTCFVIAHRLSTVRNADLILVMNNGDIAEQGSHHELIGKNGVYTHLYNSQFEN